MLVVVKLEEIVELTGVVEVDEVSLGSWLGRKTTVDGVSPVDEV
jgi:hypothetical protein